MSSKSKGKHKQPSANKMVEVALTIFLWAWVSCFHPTQEDADKMSAEIRKIRESMNAGRLNIWDVKEAMKDEFDWEIGGG